MQYIIVKSQNKITSDEINIIKGCFNSAYTITNIENDDTCLTIFLEKKEDINLDDIINMLNLEFFLNVQVFESKEFDKKDDEYYLWSKNTFLNNQFINKFIITEKDILHNINKVNNEMLKASILKSYAFDKDSLNMMKVFFECGLNTSKTAELLYMHRNTLINKLDRFYETTGYDLRRFEDAVIIYSLI